MSASDPKEPSTAPRPNESEELLGRIMTDLDLPRTGTAQRRQYHNNVRMRIFLPRITLTAVAVLLTFLLLLLLLFRPIEIRQVEQRLAEDGITQQVEVTLRGPLLLQVSAKLNGVPAVVEHRHGGVYTVKARRNGTLAITVHPLAGRLVTRTVTVEGVDEEQPHIASDRRTGDEVEIFLTDGDGTGVDWSGITAALDSGEPYPGLVVDKAAGSVRLPMPAEEVHITVPDRCGNLLHATLTPDDAD